MEPTGDIQCGRAVIAQEIKGLEALLATLDERFAEAVARIGALKGRVLVSGMGKSGHVARKIASTLSSTGTPAHFLHPAEASHGDLGMIGRQDGVLALSNSGETSELSDLIAYCKRFGIPLVAVVRRASSMLAEAADITLILPDIPEASPTGAPTTSTTMMLALGDALAVALLERRGFSLEDFAVFHPGGTLGQALLSVADLMHQELPLSREDDRMEQVLLTMTAGRFGVAGIVNAAGELRGIVTDGDLRRHMAPDLLSRRAGEVMTQNPVTIRARQLAAEALHVMNVRGITSLFVVEAGTPVGILHVHDVLRAGVA